MTEEEKKAEEEKGGDAMEVEKGEKEQDAADDKRKKVDPKAVGLSQADSTINTMVATNGKLLMSLTEGGFQYLLAGVRSTTGIKAGRYAFEVTMVESLNPQDALTHGRGPQPRQLVSFGLSTEGSSLFLGDGPDNFCFDAEGFFTHDGSKKKVGARFGRHQTATLVVNLDSKSPLANTVSLFKAGVRVGEPVAIPESMQGKALFPTVTYRNVTLHVNFGAIAKAQLPFKCRMLGDAAADDVQVKLAQPTAKAEVLFPVGLPDRGFFDWVDYFHEKNPGYTEISDRKINEWAKKSGLPGWSSKWSTNDKPDVKFSVPSLDDFTVRRVLQALSASQPRKYIVPELTANLLAGDRKENLLKFVPANFTRKAVVLMGAPDSAFQTHINALQLADKQATVEAEREREAKQKAKEAKDKPKEEGEKKEGEEDAEMKGEGGETKDEEVKTEEKTEETEEKVDEKVELTEEEKKQCRRSTGYHDVEDKVLSKHFAKFCFPSKEEGFDDVQFLWQGADESANLLKEWILEKKLTQRVDDLQPGEYFQAEWAKWNELYKKWSNLQRDFKDGKTKKAEKEKKEGEEAETEEPAAEINPDDVDVMTVEDVCDLGNGEPLFAHFAYEDWTLLSTRFELHLLIHAFKKDLNDEDRPSFTEKHLGFYFQKYFKKNFSLKYLDCETFADLTELIKDSVGVDEKTHFLTAVLPEETPAEMFVKYAEEHRRDRQQRIDAGDETAKLKFTRPPPPSASGGDRGYRGARGGQGRYDDRGSDRTRGRDDRGRDDRGRATYGSSSGARVGGGPPPKRPYQSSTPASSYPSKAPRATYGGSSYGGSGGGSYGRR